MRKSVLLVVLVEFYLNRHANAFAPSALNSVRPVSLCRSKPDIQDVEVDQIRYGFDVPPLPSSEFNPPGSTVISDDAGAVRSGWSYGDFAKTYPNVNNIGIATIKTASADLLAQVVIAQTPISEIDWQRAFLFCAFGALYLGAFQYWYQVNIFKKLFDVDKFTSQPWEDKLKDREGLVNLAAQTALDLGVLTLVYLPTFYIFKAGVFSGSSDPSMWVSQGIENYSANFAKDEFDLIRVWAPADLVCFSVPLYLRLPVRHVVSFVWTAYLSFSRGGH
ncbi:hypothetical protein HJC23_012329 [Cyclotella cryptica]|uniref:Uncharacterized protein n=1 Tax=Cyclotella cryptica TaxID=29204 RepID=A0ABD3QCB7_9STRA|eukprot:CCRYP_006524-RA/>CCRYP_006524-RA protein AED:0.37 eAED:0.37 QI:0/-1/0/1/-1/1/1/0/275